jgi:hypothetical protein
VKRTSTEIDVDGGVDETLLDAEGGTRPLGGLMVGTTKNARRRRELAHRTADGIEVTLLWRETDGTITVEVFDRGTDDVFELAVACDRALDAFYHPYAYAAHQGVGYELPIPNAT